MVAEGMVSRVPMERFSVMGLVEVLPHLPELMRERRKLVHHWIDNRPDVFIGVDAPDFNIGLARRLRKAGIVTVQYVAPTVWAWREGRVHGLRRSVDLVLSIFPFEEAFLRKHGVNATYVGHPLAACIPLEPDRQAARDALGLPADAPVLAILPGSRRSEMEALAAPFLEAAQWCLERRPDLRCVTPLVNDTVAAIFETERERVAPELPLTSARGQSHRVLAAADVVLTASGTATLEALLHKRPMVVGHRINPLTYFIARGLKLVKTPWVAMANIMAGEELAPEFLQRDCDVAHLGPAVLALFDDVERRGRIERRYRQIHEQMQGDPGDRAAQAIYDLIKGATA
jgi:lipid-A-disaccharide synthase